MSEIKYSYDKKAYDERQRRCKCLKSSRRNFIQSHLDDSADLSDAKFWARMYDANIDASELESFAIEHDCQRKKKESRG